MKKLSMYFLMLLAGLVTFVSCSDDDDPIPALTLSSLKSGSVVLDGATAATDIPVDATITATFSAALNATTVNATNVTLKKGTEAVTLTFNTSTTTVTITPSEDLEPGAVYTLSIGSAVAGEGSEAFAGLSITFTTAGKAIVTAPKAENLVAHLLFDGSTEDFTGNQTTLTSDITYVADRAGNANGAASFNGAGDVVELVYKDGLFPQNITMSWWMKSEPLSDELNEDGDYVVGSRMLLGLGGPNAFFLEHFHFSWTPEGGEPTEVNGLKFVTNHENEGTDASEFGNNWNEYKAEREADGKGLLTNVQGDVATMIDSKWVHVVLTYDSSTSLKTTYFDGVKVQQAKINYTEETTPAWNLTNLVIKEEEGMVKNFVIGAGNSEESTAPWLLYNVETTFKGLMDDFRIFNVVLTDTEVETLYNAEKID